MPSYTAHGVESAVARNLGGGVVPCGGVVGGSGSGGGVVGGLSSGGGVGGSCSGVGVAAAVPVSHVVVSAGLDTNRYFCGLMTAGGSTVIALWSGELVDVCRVCDHGRTVYGMDGVRYTFRGRPVAVSVVPEAAVERGGDCDINGSDALRAL